MSCLGTNYNPNPTREWSRVQNSCTYGDIYSSTVTIPLIGKIVPSSYLGYEIAMLNKGNVLQYKKNSANLTKSQVYSQITKGMWINRNTTWATQSQTYTNPNTTSLKRYGSINITLDGNPTSLPITCPQSIIPINNSLPSNTGIPGPVLPPPPPPPPISPSNPSIPLAPIISDIPIVVQDEGSLICNVQENPCTGETISQPANANCHPTTDSNVPGAIQPLCWNDGIQTWYPRQRYIMSNSTNKWPINAKAIFPIYP